MCNYIYKELSCQHHYHLVESWCPKYIETERRCPPTVVSKQYCRMSRTTPTKQPPVGQADPPPTTQDVVLFLIPIIPISLAVLPFTSLIPTPRLGAITRSRSMTMATVGGRRPWIPAPASQPKRETAAGSGKYEMARPPASEERRRESEPELAGDTDTADEGTPM